MISTKVDAFALTQRSLKNVVDLHFGNGFIGEWGCCSNARCSIGGVQGDFIELRSGLTSSEKVVVRGAGFLSDGDVVKVVELNMQEQAAS